MTTLSNDDAELLDLIGPEPEVAQWWHQEKEFAEHKDARSRALLWTMRTGKTKAVIDKAEYQFEQGAIEGVVVLAPNGVHLNWIINEIPRWSWPTHAAPATFGWETPKRADWSRIAALDAFMAHTGSLKWFALNMEAVSHPDVVKAVRRFRKACHRKFMLAISEAHHFGRAGAKRTKMARTFAKVAKFVTIETGTPILNSPLRAYSLYKILDPMALGPEFVKDSYEDFVKRYAVIELDKGWSEFDEDGHKKSWRKRSKAYKKITGYKNLDELRDKIAPWSSVVLRSDVRGMPPLIETQRIVIMSELQRRAYLEMVSRHLVEIGDDEVTAVDAGARVQKLQQILNGYVKDGDRILEVDPEAPIYEALVEQVDGTLPGKSIVWCRYREDIRRCVAALTASGHKVLQYHGGVPIGQREPTRLAFQNDPKYTVLVGQPAAGGEGRDFSEADAIIFFSSTPNAIHYEQAKERGTKIGGMPVSIVRIRTPGTVDDRNWSLVDGKVITADDISGRGLKELLMRTDV